MNGTIHLIEDDAGVRQALTLVLRAEGLQVHAYESATEFLEGWQQPSTPTCIVLDLVLPGMQGDELQQRLIAQNCDVPIVFLSGQGRVSTVTAVMRMGAFDFLEKPASPQKLLQVLARALTRHEADCCIREQISPIADRYAQLSRREQQVVDCVVRGYPSKQIAAMLHISESTVANHRRNIAEKMKAENTAALVRMAMLVTAVDRTATHVPGVTQRRFDNAGSKFRSARSSWTSNIA